MDYGGRENHRYERNAQLGRTVGDLIAMALSGGWNPDVQREGVRPGYGLSTATGISSAKSALDPTFGPGEQATLEDVRNSLGNILLSAGGVPGMRGGGTAAARGGTRSRGSRTYRQRMRALDERLASEKRSVTASRTLAEKRAKMSDFEVYAEAFRRGSQDAREGYRGAYENQSLGVEYPNPSLYRNAYVEGFNAGS